MRKKISALLFALSAVALISALLLSSIFAFAINGQFYEDEYDKLGQAEIIGISREDLKAVTDNLINYTVGKRDSLDMQYAVGGQVREIFNDKEKAHMVDVRALCMGAMSLNTVFYVLFGVLIAAGALIAFKGFARRMAVTYMITGAAFVVIVGGLGAWAALDFNTFWNAFHHLFFTNNLWLLDPATDLLINMVPGAFFADLVTAIIGLFALLFLIVMAICAVIILAANIMRAHSARKSGESVVVDAHE